MWSHAPVDSVTLYPEVRYRGIQVWPMSWDQDSTEPLLRVLIQPEAVLAVVGQDRLDAFIEQMKRDEGWFWDERDGGGRPFHVDELEKIEVPPPSRAF